MRSGRVARSATGLRHCFTRTTLYVVQNQLNRIAVVRLSHNLTTGKVLKFLTDPDLDVPTTLARHGKRLYAVNARFSTPPSPTTTYNVVLVKQ